jgi:membrane associated rhomboid family serine protease
VSWQDRQYDDNSGCGYDPASGPQGGLRSWVSGLPPLSKAVKWIIIANVAMFVLCLLTGGMRSPIYLSLAMNTNLVLQGQIWRLITFTYLHDQTGLGHIFFNMLGLYFLGVPLERHFGAKRFFVFYTAAGLISVMLYFFVTVIGWLSAGGILVGASAGVLGVLGACAVLFPQFRLILVFFPVPIRTAALLFVVLYSFNLLNQGDNAGGDACHLAGLAFGIAYGYRGQAWSQIWQNWRRQAEQSRWEIKQRQQYREEEEIDGILDKIRREGINSLSRREKGLLAEATRRQQEADRRDRL